MAAQPSPLSLEEFHRLYDGSKPAYEYWYGQAIQKPMPTPLHSFVQLFIVLLLRRAGWSAIHEVRLKVVSNAEPIPDVIANHSKFTRRYPTSAPELCIEVMSPDDKLSKALEKARVYLSWGSRFVWIIDPEKGTAWTLSQESAEPLWIPPSGTLRAGDTTIDLSQLFAEVHSELESPEDRS